jgi:hypothetical protein
MPPLFLVYSFNGGLSSSSLSSPLGLILCDPWTPLPPPPDSPCRPHPLDSSLSCILRSPLGVSLRLSAWPRGPHPTPHPTCSYNPTWPMMDSQP